MDPAIGTRGGADGINTPASRRLSAVYSRCAGSSALTGCDVFALDLTTLREEKVAALASKAYSETAPSVTFGNYSFVRRGSGARKGTYAYSEGAGKSRVTSPISDGQLGGSSGAAIAAAPRGRCPAPLRCP